MAEVPTILSSGTGGGGGGGGTDTTVGADQTTLSPDEECLQDRHWYAFLCSSLITFFTGLLLVLVWRIFTWTVCHKPQPPTGAHGLAPDGHPVPVVYAKPPDAQIGWVTSAQDWAGGMISGQTTTGRILVGMLLQGNGRVTVSELDQTVYS